MHSDCSHEARLGRRMGLVQRSWVVIIVPAAAGIHTRAALDSSKKPPAVGDSTCLLFNA